MDEPDEMNGARANACASNPARAPPPPPRRPGARAPAPAAPAAPARPPAPREQLIGKLRQARRRMTVCRRRQTQMGERGAVDTVRTALQQDELGPKRAQALFHLLPRSMIFTIGGTRRLRDIELGAERRAAAGLFTRAGARVERMSVFVDVGDVHTGIVLETEHHAVTVVRIDVDVGDARQSVIDAQALDDHTAIIEDAKARSAVTPRVMQSRDGNEGAATGAVHDAVRGVHTAADHAGRRLVCAGKNRRIAVIEITALLGTPLHEVDIRRGVYALDDIARRRHRVAMTHQRIHAAIHEIVPKRRLPILSERMTRGKTVTGEGLARIDAYVTWWLHASLRWTLWIERFDEAVADGAIGTGCYK